MKGEKENGGSSKGNSSLRGANAHVHVTAMTKETVTIVLTKKA